MTTWSDSARSQARAILRGHAEDLFEEAERITGRAGADSVSPQYVGHAARSLGLRRSSGVGDVLLTIGTTIAGIAAGFGITVWAASDDLHAAAWLVATAVAVGSAGVFLTGVGTTLKLRRQY